MAVYRPADPEANLDLMGRPSRLIAALEVSAAEADLRALARKTRRKVGTLCPSHSYLVHERRLMTTARHWELGEASPGLQVLTTLARKPGVSRADFLREWTEVHAEMSLAWRRVRGGDGHYVQNVVIEALDGGSLLLDGIGGIEGPGTGAVGEDERVARMETVAHAQTFQDASQAEMLVAREFIFKD